MNNKPFINLKKIDEWEQDQEGFFNTMREWGVIANEGEILCKRCKTPMYIYYGRRQWICRGSYLNKHRKRKKCNTRLSIKTNTFFSYSVMTETQILKLVRLWMRNCEARLIGEELVVTNTTLAGWTGACRDVAINECLLQRKQIGGSGVTIEMYEAEFESRKHYDGKWAFAGLERSSGNYFLIPVESRHKQHLILAIKTWVLPETEILSDFVLPDKRSILSDLDIDELKEEHSITFKDLYTAHHLKAKHRLPQHRNNKSSFLGYLAQFLFITWVNKNNRDPLEEFMRASGRMYNHFTTEVILSELNGGFEEVIVD